MYFMRPIYFEGKRLKAYLDQVHNPVMLFVQLGIYKLIGGVFGTNYNLFKWIVPIRCKDGFVAKYVFQVMKQYSPEDKPFYDALHGHDVMIDVGASIGYVSDYFLRMGGVYVYCIEPNKESAKFLRKHLTSDCKIFEVALGGANKMVKFYTNKKYDDLGSIVEKTGDCRTVQMVRLDDLDISADLIKYDCEGSDVQAIAGSIETINKYKPTIIFEDHGGKLAQVYNLLPFYKFKQLNYVTGSEKTMINWIGNYELDTSKDI